MSYEWYIQSQRDYNSGKINQRLMVVSVYKKKNNENMLEKHFDDVVFLWMFQVNSLTKNLPINN